MNIVFLLGNGFDINLGLKTSYLDFLQYYLSQKTDNSDINALKDEIKKNISLWSDLEMRLGEVSKKWSNSEGFKDMIIRLSDDLKEYIQLVSSNIQISSDHRKTIINGFCNPLMGLKKSQYEQINNYIKSYYPKDSWNLDIITFNYTDIIDKVMKVETNSVIGSNPYGQNVKLRTINHIHGTVSETILFGVDESSQIMNEEFRKSLNLLDVLVKPRSNTNIGTLIDRDCSELINKSQLLCVFGMALGPTDRTWTNAIKQNLSRSDFRLIVYQYDKNKYNFKSHGYLLGEFERSTISKITDAQDKSTLDKINVATTDQFWNLSILKSS